ncbi:hypothetical protein [Candidatus Halobonum tyrrellensis]|uniref:Uncharacterized protein n=1 Tax=Candidatus Halobonum tyrrellensis G22 TaxID=1324957 RepID=V4H862_9EURY|nr:hypothetical protein [Candidatus Halobonum tyrrellensis]ESP86865.1 hypothetical protein K933_17317 [Candidatus Halobonum tyrrellensis G22]
MLSDEEFEHICWLIWIGEQEQLDIAEEYRGENEAKSMYHGGGYDSYKSLRKILAEYDVNVEERARAYADRMGIEEVSSRVSL